MGKTEKSLSDITVRTFIKKFVYVFLPLAVLAGAILIILYRADIKTERVILETDQEIHVTLGSETITHVFNSIVSDLKFLSRHHELSQWINQHEEFDFEDLKDDMLLFSEQRGIYDQIRFLDITGKEIVRVSFEGGKSYIVPEGRLLSKKDRYYFKKSIELGQDELFISPFDLNIEVGMIEQPPKPMIRFGMPLFDKNGQKRGVLILNYLGAELVNDFLITAYHADSDIMIVNSDGYWIHSTRTDDEFGFMYEDKKDKTFGNAFPKAWARILETESGQIHTINGLFTTLC
jgi:hypothetical protein